MLPSLPRPEFPSVWNNSMYQAFLTCPRSFALGDLYSFRYPARNVNLVAGGAFASGLEAYRKAWFLDNLPSEECEAAGLAALIQAYPEPEEFSHTGKSLPRMLDALEFYFSQFSISSDHLTPFFLGDTPMIEANFIKPFPDIVHPTSGEPILFTGRADMIVSRGYNSRPAIYDDKTFSQLGPKWINQWAMAPQFSGYIWACRDYIPNLSQAIIRGICITKAGNLSHAEVPISRSDWEISLWLTQIQKDISRAISMWESGYWDYRLGVGCDGKYGECTYKIACSHPSPDSTLQTNFVRKVWNPITRTETFL